MNKAYRQVYKDGIGWVAIAENASCVSSSKGSGTVVEKSGVEVLKNFFDLRNSVVLNNGFLLKGLFAATLFCGVVISDLRAEEPTPEEIAKIQNNGTVVYTDDQNFRVVESIENGKKIFTRVDENGKPVGEGGKKLLEFEGKYYDYEKILSMKQSDGSYLINDKYYIIPDGTLGDKGMAESPVFIEKNLRYDTSSIKSSGAKIAVKGDENEGEDKNKWYIKSQYNYTALYYARFKPISIPGCKNNKELVYKNGYCYGFYSIDQLQTDKDAQGRKILSKDQDGYYIKKPNSSGTSAIGVPANEINKYGKNLSSSELNLPTGGATTPERLSLVGKDGKSTTPQKYTQADKTNGKIPAGRNIGDNKDGNIRLGNVAKALKDDEAVNLGQLNERLQNVKAKNVPYVSINSKQTGTGSNYDSKGATGEDAVAIGPNAQASAENSVAIGPNAKASEYGSVAIGADAQAINKNSVSLGAGAKTTDEDSVAIGLNAQAQGDSSYALGAWSIAAEEGATTIGTYSRANKKDSFALGVGAKANIESSVALGSDSVADTDKGIAGFDFVTDKQSTDETSTWKSTAGAVSVGDKTSDTTRQITNVAAGYAGTDAVNVAQLKAGLNNKADLNAKNLSNKTGNADETYADVWKTALGISDANIQELAQKSVVVANGENTKVEADTSVKGKTTYKVNVKLDDYAKTADINTKLGGYVKSVKGDKFINVDSTTDKQNPALSLNTTELAKDNTFVTNIAGNSVFKDTYVTNDKLADSGFKFTGDDATKKIDKKLGGTISIKGGADSELSDKNIGVVAVNNSLQVKLAKNLLGLESTEFKKGSDTTTVSAEEGVSTTKTLKVTDSGGNTVAEIDNTQIQIKDASGKTVTSINSAINNLYATTKGLTSDNALAVKYDSSTKEKIMLGGSGATKQVAIKNLASAGDINDVNNKFNAVNAGDLKTALSGVNNSIDNINNRNFTSLSVSANGGTKYDIRASENIDFTGDKGINVNYNATNNKFTFSADINSIAGNIADNNAFSNKYAMLDGSNLKPANGFDQGTWRTALGLTDSNIASIFEGGTDITITPNGNKYTIAYTGTGGGTGTGGIDQDKVRDIIREYIGSTDGSSDNIVTHDVKERKTTNNKNIIAAINKINQEGIGFVHVNGGKIDPDPTTGISANDSSAEGTNAIAIGPKSKAKGNNSISIGLESQASGGENAIAIGTGSQANGYKSIAIGVGNVVTGQNSGAFGDPSIVAGIDSYSVGNNNEINSNDTFVLGNKVRVGADMQGAVVLGSGSTAVDKATQESRATVNGITYDGFKGQAASDGMILSVGAKNAERQIKNVAAGEILADSTDAVNGSQLYATNNIIGNVANSVKNVIGGNAKVNKDGKISASNIGGTDQPTINDAIASINNKINSGGKSYIAIDVPTNGGGVPIASKGSNSIVIGAGSSDDKRKNVVSVGNAKTGLNRTITNVAPGKYGTDAVNMNQLYGVAGGLSKQINDVKKKSSAGIAGAVALGMLPQSNIPGDALVSIGTGYHDSESAVALGISKTSDNARWIFKGGVSYDSQDEVTAGASVGFHF